MRGPAGMCNAGKTAERTVLHLPFQIRHARGAARTLQLAVHMQGDATRVVATVFETF